MADISRDQVVDYLSNLPVIQIAELIKTLEDKWGVKAAPAAVAMVGGGAAPAAAAEEKTEFTVVLTVQNNGQATAVNVSPVANLTVSAPANVTPLVVPSLAGVTLPAGQTASFTWTFTTLATSTNVAFTASAWGQDLNTLANVTLAAAASNLVQVVDTNPLLQAVFLGVTPSVQTSGQQVTAVLRVTNANTLVTATNVSVTATGLTPVTMTGALAGGLPSRSRRRRPDCPRSPSDRPGWAR